MLKINLNPLTLKSMTSNTIALDLWKPEIEREFIYLFDDESPTGHVWCKIQERIVEKMSHLPLSESLKQKMDEVIDIIKLRLPAWVKKIIDLLPETYIQNYIHLISLNSYGEIDRKKTAASILKAVPNMDPYLRYRFACTYCLEDDVRSLWKTLPAADKHDILHNESNMIQWYHDVDVIDDIVFYWSCFISQKFDLLSRNTKSDNINDHFIRNSIYSSNVVAFKYFWERLSDEERRKNIVEYAVELHSVDGALCDSYKNLADETIDIWLFLASQMSEVQLKEVVEKDPSAALNFWCCCEDWKEEFISWIHFLDSLWDFMSFTDYHEFLFQFVECRIHKPKKSDYIVRKDRRIFKELWENTPDKIKREFFENVSDIEDILYLFIIRADVENLQLIFDDATDEERKEIVNHSFSRERFVFILESDCFYGIYEEDLSLTEDEIENSLQNILTSFKEKQVKGWPLLNNLSKLKRRTTS